MSTKIINGDSLTALSELDSESVQCCVTSPPYLNLRDYGAKGQIGLESSPELYVEKIVSVMREIKRILKKDGTLWLNLGDSYNGTGAKNGQADCGPKQTTNRGSIFQPAKSYSGLKQKDLIGIPWMVAFALRADGWWLRQDIIWHKPNPMPESVRDRCTKAHEYIFLLSKSGRYYFDADAILEPFADREFRGKICGERGDQPYAKARGGDRCNSGGFPRVRSGKNKRSVWSVVSKPFKGAHFATFSPELIEPCVLAGSKPSDIVIDPFHGVRYYRTGSLEAWKKIHRR